MSPVIAFDIAVVAQKVKVQCCYIMADMLNLKKWGWVSSRSGWLLELLTELKMAMYCQQGSGLLRQQLLMMYGIAWYCIVLPGIARYCMVLHDNAWY